MSTQWAVFYLSQLPSFILTGMLNTGVRRTWAAPRAELHREAGQQVPLEKVPCCGCLAEAGNVMRTDWGIPVAHQSETTGDIHAVLPTLRQLLCLASATMLHTFPEWPCPGSRNAASKLGALAVPTPAASSALMDGHWEARPAPLWSCSMHALHNHAPYWRDQSRSKQRELPAWLMGILVLFYPQQKSCGALCPRTRPWEALSFSEYFSPPSTRIPGYTVWRLWWLFSLTVVLWD